MINYFISRHVFFILMCCFRIYTFQLISLKACFLFCMINFRIEVLKSIPLMPWLILSELIEMVFIHVECSVAKIIIFD